MLQSAAQLSTTQPAVTEATPTEAIAWNDRLLLGYPAMDAEHREFVDRVQALQFAAEDQQLARLQNFADHARQHFESENGWMTETQFPARDCHIDEHAAVLRSVDEVLALARAGNLKPVRSLAAELARWFPGHADYLDSALAAWMCKQRWQGQPVVLRREILQR